MEERQLLSIVAIVKNEVSNFGKTLASVLPVIDRWTVLDTGSTDGTQSLVMGTLLNKKTGLLYQ
jgi:glycosyltransferase involved in cell wall biosynthesis